MERVIRAENLKDGKEAITSRYITKADLESIKVLDGCGEEITDLSGLEYCINLDTDEVVFRDSFPVKKGQFPHNDKIKL